MYEEDREISRSLYILMVVTNAKLKALNPKLFYFYEVQHKSG